MELREKIVALVGDIATDGDEDYSATKECHARIADAILAIPEIRDALSRKVYRRNAPASTVKAQRLKIV